MQLHVIQCKAIKHMRRSSYVIRYWQWQCLITRSGPVWKLFWPEFITDKEIMKLLLFNIHKPLQQVQCYTRKATAPWDSTYTQLSHNGSWWFQGKTWTLIEKVLGLIPSQLCVQTSLPSPLSMIKLWDSEIYQASTMFHSSHWTIRYSLQTTVFIITIPVGVTVSALWVSATSKMDSRLA
jgi:hypothetical protein